MTLPFTMFIEIYCLGDIVGYGPDPCECVDRLMGCQVALLGNPDLAAIRNDPVGELESQRHMIWTRRQLASPTPDYDTSRRRREYLSHLPITHRDGDYLFLHGGPRDPVHEYVFPEDIYNQRKMQAIFALVDRYCFMGHTHSPGVFTEDLRFISLEECGGQWQLGGCKTLCNVGSVGQPLDSDLRACYVLLDRAVVSFRRVDYDIQATAARMFGIDDFSTDV